MRGPDQVGVCLGLDTAVGRPCLENGVVPKTGNAHFLNRVANASNGKVTICAVHIGLVF